MPEVLDKCVKDVKAKLIKEGIDEKEAESRAWAICKEELKMQRILDNFKNKFNRLIDDLEKEL